MTQGSPHTLGLYQRILRAATWDIGAYGADVLTRLVSTIVLTRLLFPEAFGLIALASSLIAGLALISDFGIRTVVIQSSRGDDDGFLRSAWTLQIWRGLLLWLILVVLCLVIGFPTVRQEFPAESVFASADFSLVTSAMGLNLILGGIESTAVYLNVRRLNFRPIVVLELASRLLSLPVVILWAWLSPSVWALVGGGLIAGILRVIISHIFMPGPLMSLNWNRQHFREIVRFGKWIAVSSTATFVSAHSERIILGFLVSASALGLYAISKTLIDVIFGLFERLNSSLTLPVLGEVISQGQDNRSFKDKYYRFRFPIECTAGLSGGILFSVGSFVIQTVFDLRYADAGPMVQILAVGIIAYPANFIAGAFTAHGEPWVVAVTSILRATSLVICIAAGYLLGGFLGCIWGIALHAMIPAAIILLLAHRRKWIDIWKEIRIVLIFIVGILIGEGILAVATFIGLAPSGGLLR